MNPPQNPSAISLRKLFIFLFLANALGIISGFAQSGKAVGDVLNICPKCNYRWSTPNGATVCPKCGFGGSSPTTPATPTYDYEAERRQQEAAKAAAAAEAAEAERLRVAEAARIKAEADKRQADFIRMRDETVLLLKDSGGNSGLKGVNEYGLKDSGGNSASPNNSGLKGVNEYGLKDAGDPKVVNAIGVPSGLPKSVEEAIPHTPAGDRVRKGFQAIAAHDWKVALAWFQDALNHEPSDPSLKRLVNLAQFTINYRLRAEVLDSNFTPAQNSTIKSGGGAVLNSDIDIEHIDCIAISTASQMAGRERAAAVFKKFTDEHGDHDIPARTAATRRASRGEGYSREELDAGFQKALALYQKEHRNRKPADSMPKSVQEPAKSVPDSPWGAFLRFFNMDPNKPDDGENCISLGGKG